MADSKNITVEALYTKSTENFDDKPVVAGYEFDQGLDYEKLMKSLTTTGFQATNFGLAVDQINQMVRNVILYDYQFLNSCFTAQAQE